MKLEIDIGAETEAALRIEAADNGMSVESLTEKIVRDHAAHPHVQQTLAEFMNNEFSMREGYAELPHKSDTKKA